MDGSALRLETKSETPGENPESTGQADASDGFASDRQVPDRQAWDKRAWEQSEEFAELYRTHRVQLHRLALRLTGEADRAEDIVSEAFLRAWRAYGKFRGEAAFGTWMHRILTNLVYDRPARRELELPEHLPATGGPDPHDRAEASLVRERIDEALAVLTPSQRQVFLLRELEGKKHAAIGAALGISESTSKVHYFHALKRLREELHDLV